MCKFSDVASSCLALVWCVLPGIPEGAGVRTPGIDSAAGTEVEGGRPVAVPGEVDEDQAGVRSTAGAAWRTEG